MPFSEIQLPLRGAGGEPVDLWRTIMSHGVASLPPLRVDEQARTLTATLALSGSKPRTVTIDQGRKGAARIRIAGPAVSAGARDKILEAVRHILALDRNLSGFYAMIGDDPDLAWVAQQGAGRMIRSQTVFEDVVKTVCTTNCAWSATVRMVTAMVEHLGVPAVGATNAGSAAAEGKAFPTPQALADAPESFYRDVIRAGYRGPYFRKLAASVVSGELDLEAFATATSDQMSDDQMFKELQALPGVGPYAAAHIMMMIGRHSRPILDSWTRPTYARLIGRKTVTDQAIARRFKRYGEHAGLAFWLTLTNDWVQ